MERLEDVLFSEAADSCAVVIKDGDDGIVRVRS